ncbi:MAG: four helix bundle protein [Deltaproteobacteria bacterium]|nr:MAG: four helix bundle protein [Deltaproteobacteria bacterium]
MSTFNDYRNLEVWQRAMGIAKEIYCLTKSFPPSELYGLTSQMRRATVSIPANIAEGWGRRYTAEFIRFLRQANGSRTELETHLLLSAKIGLSKQERIQPLLTELHILGKRLLRLERTLKQKKNS